MRLRGRGLHLIGTEGSSPPLPYIEVDEGEAEVLIRLGYAEEVTGRAEKARQEGGAEGGNPTAASAPASASAPPHGAEGGRPPVEEPKPEGGETRAETILHALDLVEGEPTVEAIAEITGLADVTAEEVAAAVAAKAAE
jgi:hypothetical protein